MKVYDGDGAVAPAEGGDNAGGRRERRSVGVADFAVTDDGATLVTSGLGSCVAVCITDGVVAAGLAHVMLPSAEGRTVDNPAKFADTGVVAMIEALTARDADRESLRAKIAGGSEMITFRSQARSVGDRNVESVRNVLEAEAVPLVGEDVGGTEGRSVEFATPGDLIVRTATDGPRKL